MLIKPCCCSATRASPAASEDESHNESAARRIEEAGKALVCSFRASRLFSRSLSGASCNPHRIALPLRIHAAIPIREHRVARLCMPAWDTTHVHNIYIRRAAHTRSVVCVCVCCAVVAVVDYLGLDPQTRLLLGRMARKVRYAMSY